uniref:ArnR1-like winged helix-turn-helix domain-containing protein n=1 Tax=Candidatus Methanogaster sp. ANME-2c ERB4 TaxID=2759911 RepID=A0A7G9YPE3_9EURY|nr:hypothetical protein HMIKAMFF_00037 [Methanosarcinales archaeon ANME-2c ERB4]
MRDEMKTAGLLEPEFNWNGFFRITFKRSEKRDMEITATVGTVSDIDLRISELIKNGEIVRRPDVERLLQLSYASAQRHLANLVERELILFEGAPKTGKYVLTRKGEKFLASLKKKGDHR